MASKSAKKGPGRPTSLTDDMVLKIITCLQGGNYRMIAAQAGGIAVSTFTRWMRWGVKDPDSEYGAFRALVLEAEARAEAATVQEIKESQDPIDRKWWLARRWPERWGVGRDDYAKMKRELRACRKLLEKMQKDRAAPRG
ncbi:MAG: hypothetical protein JWO38_8256 [Gemmataceae bacterium]|nr:hypothetical protein [Gemmataceae bacterium]